MRIAVISIATFLFLQAPDASFISEFRKTLRSDNELLQNYSYTETETRTETDRNGKPKSTEINIYEIAPEGGQLYRRMVSKNGVPLTRDQEMKTLVPPRD